MALVRDTDDYREIILTVGPGASIHAVIESALRLVIIEGTIVRFEFNDVEIIIDPIKIRDHIIKQYHTLRKEV